MMNDNENQPQLLLNLSSAEETVPIEVEENLIDETQVETAEPVAWTTNLLSEKCREGDKKSIRLFVEYSRQTSGCKKHAIEMLDRLDSETNLSPLHHAARYQQVDICFMLLSFLHLPCGVNIKDSNDRTPIHLAFRSSSKTTNNMPTPKEPNELEEILGNEFQDFDAWVEDYITTIHTVDHPLIYLFAKTKGDLNARDKYLLTPLHYAVAQNNLPGVKQLISFRVNVEARDRQGVRPIHLACREGYLFIVKYLIEHQVEIDATDDEQWTPLHYACARGHLEIIELLKMTNEKLFRTLIQRKTNTGATCVHLAVQHGNRRSVDYLLNQFHDDSLNKLLHEQAKPFGTPLHFAAKFCDPSMIKLLFHYNVDPSILNSENQSPLHIACASNRFVIVQILLSYTKSSLLEIKDHQGQTALSLTSNSDIVDELIAKHVDLSSIDNNSMNVLMIAISKSQYVIVEHLLAAIHNDDSSIFEQTEKRYHRSAFLIAVQKGSLEICSALLKHPSICWDKVDKQRMNAFHLAARYNHHEIIELLVEHIRQQDPYLTLKSRTLSRTTSIISSGQMSILQSASVLQNNINTQDEDGKTPLHLAAEFGHTLSLEVLLKSGADPLSTNFTGQLPLHIAIQHGHVQCVDLLLKSSKRNKNDFQAALARRQSPLNTACRNGFTDIVQLLLAQQDDLDDAIDFQTKMSKNDLNPLEIAIKYRQKETVQALLEHPNVEHWLTIIRKTPDDIHQTPLREMIRYMPECAENVFDRFIVKTNEIDSMGNETKRMTYKYKLIDDYFLENQRLYGANRNQIYRNHPFIIALDCNHYSLLQHPLAQQLMIRKWQLYRSFFYLTRMLTFLLLLILTLYVLLIPAPINKKPVTYTLKFIDDIYEPMRWSIVGLAGMNIIKILFETILYRGFRVPFAQIFSLISFLTALIAFLPMTKNKETLFWQWQLASFSTLFQWFNAAFILRSVPFVGNFIVMFQSILLNFFSLIFVILPLLIAFTFSTQMLFFNHLPFQTIILATHKLSAMLIGEFDYHGLFFSKPVLTGAALIFFPFVMVMSIAFMNLLLGLSIGDIQRCLEDAESKSHSYRIRELIYIEATLPSLTLLKSFLIDEQTIKVEDKDEQIEKESDDNETDSSIISAQRSTNVESRKLLDILNMLCTQAKQTLEREINLERVLKQLLKIDKNHISVSSNVDEMNTSR